MEIEIKLTDRVSNRASSIKLKLEEIENLSDVQRSDVFNSLIPKLKKLLDKTPIPRPQEFINISTTVLDEKGKCYKTGKECEQDCHGLCKESM